MAGFHACRRTLFRRSLAAVAVGLFCAAFPHGSRAQDTANSNAAFWVEEFQRRARSQFRPEQRIRRLMPRREFARPTIWHERPIFARPGPSSVPAEPSVAALPSADTPPLPRATIVNVPTAPKTPPPASPAAISAATATPSKAFVVGVVGDTLAQWLAMGLGEAFPAGQGVTVLNKGRDSSGLVRDDFYDWPKALRELVAGTHLDALVVMVGSNDRQPLRSEKGDETPLSKGWEAIYSRRVETMVSVAREKKIPVLWVGMPIMKNERFNLDMGAINDIDKARVEAGGGRYIDVFDAFADERGVYSAFGPDVNGTIVKLRSGDGVHFTANGARKLAHFLEGDLRRLRDGVNAPQPAPTSPVATLPDTSQQPSSDTPEREQASIPLIATAPVTSPVRERAAMGPVLTLTAAPMSPGGELVGASPTSRVSDKQRAGAETDTARTFRRNGSELPR